MAKRQNIGAARISVRYYLWSLHGLLRIPQGLHHELMSGEIALPQFAGTRQKVLEVFIKRLTSTDFSLTARGVIYPFEARGYLDIKTMALAHSSEFGRSRSAGENIIDLTTSIKKRRYQEKFTWKPTKAMINDVWRDIAPSARTKKARLPSLRSLRSGRRIR